MAMSLRLRWAKKVGRDLKSRKRRHKSRWGTVHIKHVHMNISPIFWHCFSFSYELLLVYQIHDKFKQVQSKCFRIWYFYYKTCDRFMCRGLPWCCILKILNLGNLLENVNWKLWHATNSTLYSVWSSRCNALMPKLFISNLNFKLKLELWSLIKMSHDMTKPTKWLCAQRRLRSAWHPPSLIIVFAVRLMGSYGPKLSSCRQQRRWSDWADDQADLSLRWAHSHIVGFVMRWLKCMDGNGNRFYASDTKMKNRLLESLARHFNTSLLPVEVKGSDRSI